MRGTNEKITVDEELRNSIRDAVSGRNKPKTAPWVECPRPPVGSSDRKHSFIS
jgi:hypothetical protein